MKKLLALSLGLALLGLVSTNAEEKKKDGEHKKPALTEEQKKLKKAMDAKYDANKDGKLDKEEREKMSDEDKKKCKDAGLGRGHKEGEKKHEKKDK